FLIFSLFKKVGKKEVIAFAIYGIIFFCLNHFYYDLPRSVRKLYLPAYTFLEYFIFTFLLWSNIPNRFFIKMKVGNKSTKVSFRNLLFILCSSFFSVFLLYHYSTSRVE